MDTKTALRELYGDVAHEHFQTRLASIGDDLVSQHEAREARRLAEAEVRDQMTGYGPLIEHAAREIQAAQKEALFESDAPVVTTFEAYCIVKDASKADATDPVLKTAAHSLYHRWNNDPMGVMTLGELAQMRERFTNMGPKSAIKGVIDEQIIGGAGFHTLPNIAALSRVADTVRDQETYERAVESLGIAGDSMKDISARAYLRHEAERRVAARLDDGSFKASKAPTIEDAIQRALHRFAQEDMPVDENLEDLGMTESEMGMAPEGFDTMDEGMDEGMDDVYAPGEEELPHDEVSEEMASITSPITGEDLVVELGISSDRGVEGFDIEPGMDEELPSGGALPSMGEPTAANFQATARARRRFAQVDDMGGDMMPPDDMGEMPMDDEYMMDEGMDEPAGASETVTVITDPSSGQELELVLRPITEEGPEEAEEIPEIMDEGMGMDQGMGEGGMGMMSTASRRRAEMPTPKVRGQQPDSVPGMDASVLRNSKKKSKEKKSVSSEDVKKVCAAQGLSLKQIEEKLLSGDAVFGGAKIAANVRAWGLGVDDGDNIALVQYRPDGEIARVVRTAGFFEFDSIARDFQLRVAASVLENEVDTSKGTLLVARLPKKDPLVARRVMAQVWRLVPDAEGDMNGTDLVVSLPKAASREVNAVMRTLKDVFGVREIKAQMMPGVPPMNTGAPVGPSTMPSMPSMPSMPGGLQTGVGANAMQSQMGMVETGEMEMEAENQNSPYGGKSPVAKQPAGSPAKPMQAPQQTANVGMSAQKDFMAQHTNPMRPGALKASRRAQMAPEMGEGMGEGMDEMPMREPTPPLDMTPDMDGAGDAEDMMGGLGGGAGGMEMPGMQDASQMPIEMGGGAGGGELQQGDEDAARAALQHFRNIGMLPLEALHKFVSDYGVMLEKYGDETSPQRAMAEAAVIRLMGEAFQKPAVIPAKGASYHVAEMPTPKVRYQQPDAVKMKMNFSEGDMPKMKVEKPKAPQGKYPNKKMTGHGDDSSHSFGPGAPSNDPHAGSNYVNKGEHFPSTDLGHDNSSGDTAFDSMMEGLSKSAPSATQSKLQKKKKSASGHLFIRFDDDSGTFALERGNKRIASGYEELSDALRAANTRRLGTDTRVFLVASNGTTEEV